MSAAAETVRGSCACAAVAFEITAPMEVMANCHCSMCRRQHGTAFSTYGRVPAANFHIRRGRDRICTYASSAAAARCFCGECGTKLTFMSHDDPAHVWVAVGALDDDTGVRPSYHLFVASKAPWYRISDDLTQYAAYPPSAY